MHWSDYKQRSLLWSAVGIACSLLAIAQASAAENQEQPDFRLPPGFSIERASGSPEIHFPMFGALDDRRRLFVTESSGGDLYAELQRQVKGCRISRLADTNGDGIYDQATVFASGLAPSMGLVWRDGKLYAADPPELVTFEDNDDDGHAEKRTVVLKGFGHTDNGSLHGLTFGPDGWLYLTMGDPDGYSVTGPDGSHTEGKTGALIRCRPDGSRVETIAFGFENLVEVVWLRDGSMIGTVTWYFLPERGVRDVLVHLLDGGEFPLHTDKRPSGMIDFNGVLPPVSIYPAVAHSGIMRYVGGAFPARMQDNLFTAEHNTRKVVRHVLTPRDASYAVQDIDFITTEDPSVHFSDVLEDEDGSLLVIDTGSWYVHHCPTGHMIHSPAKGGVYRVRYRGENREPVAVAKGGRNQADPYASPAMLFEQVRGTNGTQAAFAARALGRLGAKNAAPDLIRLLKSADLQIRLAAAESLAYCGDAGSVPPLIDALADRTDEFLIHAITFALHRLADRPAVEGALQHPSPKVQRAALLLLAQPPFNGARPEQVRERLFADYEPLRNTARWVLENHPEWGEVGAAFIVQLVRLKQPTEADRAALEKTLPEFQANTTVIQSIADRLQGNLPGVTEEEQKRLANALALTALKNLPDAWAEAIRHLLAEDKPGLRESSIRAASAWKISGVEPSLSRIARDNTESAELRVEALRELVRRQGRLAEADFEFLRGQLAPGQPSTVRLGAAEALLSAALSTPQMVRFLKAVQGDNLIAPVSVLSAVERHGARECTASLLDYLNASLDAGWTLPGDRVTAICHSLPSEQQPVVQKLVNRLAEMAERQKQRLAEYEPLLAGGNREQGQLLFYGKAQCSLCHAVSGRGGNVGPDLTKIGAIRAGGDILESIVLPSATIAQGYDVLNVNLKDGESITGVRVGKSEDPLILRDATGRETRHPQSSIETIQRSKLSLMPEGLLQPLGPDEVRDLLAFLQSLK